LGCTELQTRCANCGLTEGMRLMARDTVAVDTLARFAISRMPPASMPESAHCT